MVPVVIHFEFKLPYLLVNPREVSCKVYLVAFSLVKVSELFLQNLNLISADFSRVREALRRRLDPVNVLQCLEDLVIKLVVLVPHHLYVYEHVIVLFLVLV